jgi:mRNA-degrading endonuclease RelE of RelBE toxin-antitoxin system
MAVRLTKRAQKDLEQLPEALQEKALALIKRLETEPALGKKLLGPLAGVRSLRLGRTHRILYEDKHQIAVLTIPMRRDAYR